MIRHIAAIKALLTPLGYPVYFVDVPDTPALPYVLLWGSAGSLSSEVAVCGTREDLDTQIGVTTVAGTPEGVLIVAARVRATLTPLGMGDLPVEGRRAWLRLEDSRTVQVDRDVPVTGTDRFVAYGVDLYRLVSVPAA